MSQPAFLHYFPELTARQISQYEALQSLYEDWNAKINVISRKDIDNLYEHHVQHSLAIAKFVDERQLWPAGTSIVDVGCGGGFPGIPLAIKYPDCIHTFPSGGFEPERSSRSTIFPQRGRSGIIVSGL